MERFVGKNAIVTGSSSGSGLEIAKELLKRGVHVAGLARRTDRLEKFRDEVDASTEYKGTFYPVKCDLTKEEEIVSATKWVFDNLGPVHILINNAGVLDRTFLLEATDAQIRGSFDVNVKATILCSREVVRNMIENKTEGHIVNINGIAGIVAVNVEPNIYMLYCSTKHAQRVISEGLRREAMARKINVKVTNLCPGYVRTELSEGVELPPEYDDTVLFPTDVAGSCMVILDSPSNVLISEMVVLPLHLKF